MSGALGFFLNAAGLFVPLALQADYAKKAEAPKEATGVQIITGSGKGGSPGGNVPHIALWDDSGNRIGQYHAGRKEKIDDGEHATIIVPHNQNKYKQADPYYIMLSNFEHDAICIAAVTVANQKISGTFYGDTGYMCGQSWFLSENRIGSNFQKPKCVWLDGDHTNDINARAISFHLNDLAPNKDKLAQYQDHPETLCQSTPRFSFWGNLLSDGIIPFFKPPLQYGEDSTNSGEGADVDLSRVVDRKDQYDKSVYLHQGEKKFRVNARANFRRNATSNGSNHNPDHLIITDQKDDDVRAVCEHPNSYGWDIVSTVQNLYCDMVHKQLYKVCDGKEFKDYCFDLKAKTIIPKQGITARDEFAAHVPNKAYTSQSHWKN